MATFDQHGNIKETNKFKTPVDYIDFINILASSVAKLSTTNFKAACVAAPGRINRKHGVAIAFGNLPWKNVPLARDVERIANCPTLIDNDANLAGLSEANLLNGYERVLYITISTGIGTGLITKGIIDPEHADSEGGAILLEHKGKNQKWESFASGKAIVATYGKLAGEINDEATWKLISSDIAKGMSNLIAILQPDVIIIGGGVGTHFKKYEKTLQKALKKYETPLTPIPPVKGAKRPEDAVVYGCYELIRQTYGTNS